MIGLIKKLAYLLSEPLAVGSLLVILAAVLALCRRRRAAVWLLAGATAVVYLGSISLVSDALLRPLERKFSPLGDQGGPPDIEYVVVLGSSYVPRDGIPVTAALDSEGLMRVVEGVRLYRRLGAKYLVLSGGAPAGAATPSQGYSILARSLGVGDSAVVQLSRPRDTAAEADAVAALIGARPCLLVTSAYHMPRAMRLMERVGVRAMPAPTAQHLSSRNASWWRVWMPSHEGLRKTEFALHEYFGLLALSMGLV
jgi:uncharacterized SAM-binding protein YcdF (DUF218 family)